VSQVGSVRLRGVSIVSLLIDGKERLCLAQISNTLLKNFSYNEIHNRRVALGITCVQVYQTSAQTSTRAILREARGRPLFKSLPLCGPQMQCQVFALCSVCARH